MAAGEWAFVGNAPAVSALQGAIQQSRVRHAYLFAGPHAVGKRTLAQRFTQALLCEAPPGPAIPCRDCRTCRKVDRGVHPDVQRFDIGSQPTGKNATKNTSLTIETVRALTGQAALRPMEGAWRVTILDDAETMQEAAQEALLKTLEEPPPFTIIILLATDAEMLLPTVRSRCQLVDLRPVAASQITSALVDTGADEDAASDIAALADGAPGWAFRALEDRSLLEERVAAVDRALTWIGEAPFPRVAMAFALGDAFQKRRESVFADMSVTLSVWRDVMMAGAEHPGGIRFRMRMAGIEGFARQWTLTESLNAVNAVRRCMADLEANVRPRLALETMVMQWPTPR